MPNGVGETGDKVKPETPRATEEVKKEAADPVTQAAPSDGFAPISVDEFREMRDQLFARARAAGMRPLQLMLMEYARQGMALFEGVLSSLDENSRKRGAPKEEQPKEVQARQKDEKGSSEEKG